MSLYQRGKSWYYDFQYRGERYTGCIGPISRTVAKEVMAKKKAEAVEGRYELPSKKLTPKLEEFAKEYFAYYRANRRPRSAERHETSYRAMHSTFGHARLADITPLAIERYKRQRKDEGVSEATINRELAFLKNLFTKAIECGMTAENPVKRVRLYREQDGRTRYLTEDEESRLLACCGPQLQPLVITALHTGFRASELRSLTWNDVDFRRRLITVRAGYAKNGEARSVPMNQLLTDILKSVKLANDKGDQVFCSREGTPYRSFRSAFERAVRKAEIKDFAFHDLRHTFASRLVMAGVDLPTVKELLGHRDISMTMRYTHLSSRHKQMAVGKLEQFAAKVPAIFTTLSTRQTRDRSQVFENLNAPVAQPG
jgi:integrase